MSGSNAGTGYALALRCFFCRRKAPGGSTGRRLEATGRSKPIPAYRVKSDYRCTDRLIEIRCLSCGALGWTKHEDAERLMFDAKESGQTTIPIPTKEK